MKEWWNKNKAIALENQNLQDILTFFLFNCPCEIERGSLSNGTKKYEKVSARAETLRQMGWVKGHVQTLLAAMKRTASGSLVFEHLKTTVSIANVVANIEKNVAFADEHYEMIVICERSDMNLTSAIFYYIRNALAHGSFSIIDTTYYFESAKEGVVKARIRLREATLLEWIKLVSLSPQKLRNAMKENNKVHRRKKGNVA